MTGCNNLWEDLRAFPCGIHYSLYIRNRGRRGHQGRERRAVDKGVGRPAIKEGNVLVGSGTTVATFDS